MNRIDLSLNDEHLLAIGQITCNFAMLEHLVSFSIWTMIVKEDLIINASKQIPKHDLEQLIRFCISTSAGLENAFESKVGQIITAELSFRKKVDLLSSLYKYQIGQGQVKGISSFDDMISKLLEAEERRNIITHSLWVTAYEEEEATTRIKLTAKQKMGLKLHSENLAIKDLNDVADFIAEVAYSVQEFSLGLYRS